MPNHGNINKSCARSLSWSSTAVEATLLNTAANLLTTAAAGYAVYHETLQLRFVSCHC